MWIHQQKVSDQHLDSFWYDGLIAETDDFELMAVGEIIVYYKGEKLNEQQALEVADKNNWTDENIYNEFEFDYNNWFEILTKDGGSSLIADNYNEGIKLLLQEQKEYNNDQ